MESGNDHDDAAVAYVVIFVNYLSFQSAFPSIIKATNTQVKLMIRKSFLSLQVYPLDTLALKMLNVIREELRDEIERREEKAVRDAQIAAKAERRQKRLDEKAKEMAKVGVRIDEEDVADELDKEEVRIVKTYYHEIVSHCLSVVVALTFTAAVVLWWLLGSELG